MAKKTSSKVSAGTTANPAPTAAAAPAQAAASSSTPEAAPAPAAPRRLTTAGSPRPATAQAATENDQAHLTAQLAAMLGGSVTGEDDDTTTAAPAPTGDTQAADDASSNTPEDDAATAEDSEHTGEEAADAAAASGEPDDEEFRESDSQAEDEAAEADDDALEALAAAKKWPKSFLRRLQRERKARNRTESELESLRQEVAALKTGRNAPAGADTADDAAPVTDEETRLSREAEQLQRTLRTLARNRDGMTITVDGQPRDLSADDVEEYRETYRRQLAKADVKLENLREQRAQRSQALEGELLTRHPWMRDKADPGRSMVESALRQYPVLAAVPEMRLVLANNVAYVRLLERAAKTNGAKAPSANGNGQPAAPPPPRTAPRTVSRPAAAPTATRGDRSSMQAAIKRFNETGNPDDGKLLVSALLE